jgi:type IV pilus assembly protein PilW
MNTGVLATARQRGFTITEMLVAAVIGLILLGGAISMLVTSRQTYETQNDLARIQENARFAIEEMMQDIRMAGYFGCHDAVDNVRNQLNGATAGDLYDMNPPAGRGTPLQGLEEDAGAWAPSNNSADHVVATLGGGNEGDAIQGDAVNGIMGSDAITIYRMGGVSWPVTAAMAGPSSTISMTNTLTENQVILPNDIVVVSDCVSADIFNVTGAPAAGAAGSLSHATGGQARENAAVTLSKRYDTTAIVAPYVAVRYFVGRSSNTSAEPALFRRVLVQGQENNEKMVDGVETMQILYGVDNNGDSQPDTYVTADAGELGNTRENWRSVVAVRIALLLRSSTETRPDRDTNTYTINGEPMLGGAPPNDRRNRRIVMSTVFLRNNSF